MAHSNKNIAGASLLASVLALVLAVLFTPFLFEKGVSEAKSSTTTTTTTPRIYNSTSTLNKPRISTFPPVSIIGSDTSAISKALELLGYSFVAAAGNGTCLPSHSFALGKAEGCVEDVRVVVVGGGEGWEARGGGERVWRMQTQTQSVGGGRERRWEELVGFLGVGYSVLERGSLRDWPLRDTVGFGGRIVKWMGL